MSGNGSALDFQEPMIVPNVCSLSMDTRRKIKKSVQGETSGSIDLAVTSGTRAIL